MTFLEQYPGELSFPMVRCGKCHELVSKNNAKYLEIETEEDGLFEEWLCIECVTKISTLGD